MRGLGVRVKGLGGHKGGHGHCTPLMSVLLDLIFIIFIYSILLNDGLNDNSSSSSNDSGSSSSSSSSSSSCSSSSRRSSSSVVVVVICV